jgi:WD40 repeat protein
MAEQEEPVRRRVALKVIKLGMDTKQVVARFEAERQALALMDHPNIAKVLDAGASAAGRPYFVMELVRGVKITEYCDEVKLATRARLDLFIQVCQAIQHAHQKGIIHRDIKPSNILVTVNDGVPVPKVIDFGIAKATTGQQLTDKTLFTAFEQFIGTPAYMSPEQAVMTSLDIDTRSDIYALGVLLYELLTAKTPFDPKELLAAGFDEMRRTIREKEPVRPSTRVSSLPGEELSTTAHCRGLEAPKLVHLLRGDLDWIVMKCLEKDRTRRYETANGLVMDVRRYLDHEPVVARPPSTAYRFQKLVRRNKFAFVAAGGIALALALGLVVSTWQAVVATRARIVAVAARQEAESARSSETQQRQQAVEARNRAETQQLEARRNLYVTEMALAYQALQIGHLGRARELQQKAAQVAALSNAGNSGQSARSSDLRGWEWRYLWSQTRGDELFILGRHDPLAQVALWMPDGIRAVTSGRDGLVKFWNVDERRVVKQLNFPQRVNGLALSPTGTRLATGLEKGAISLWDTVNLQSLWQVKLPHFVGQMAYSPDGEMIAVAGGNKVSVLWAKDGSLRREVGEGGSNFGWKCGLAFTSDCQFLAYSVSNPEVRVLDLQHGTDERLTKPGSEEVFTLAYSPDGRKLVAGDRSAITIWDWPAGRIDRVLRSHNAVIVCVAFSPDGKSLASASADQSIKLWDTQTWTETATLRGHEFEIQSVAFSPDGKRLISSAKDDTIRVWPTSATNRKEDITLPPDTVKFVCADRVNPRLLSVSPDTGDFTLHDLFSGKELWRGKLPLPKATAVRLLPGQIIFGFRDGFVQSFDLRSQARLWSMTNHTSSVAALAGSASVQKIAVGYEDGRIDLLDANSGTVMRSLQTVPLTGVNRATLEISADGRRLLAAPYGSMELSVWNLENGDLKRLQLKHREGILSAVFSDDGEWIVTTSYDAFASLWEVNSGRELARFTGQFIGFHQAAISPDKTKVALVSNDWELSVWDPANQQPIIPPQKDAGSFVAWDPQGECIATLSGPRLHLWRAPSWAEIEAAGHPAANRRVE